MSGPFDRFTPEARRMLSLAQDEARRRGHGFIGTEHFLLGVAGQKGTAAARALGAMGVGLDRVIAVTEIIEHGDRAAACEPSLTPRAKRVITLAGEQSRLLGHGHVGAEHVLLGLVDGGDGIAAGVLRSLGATAELVRAAVMAELSGMQPDESRPPTE